MASLSFRLLVGFIAFALPLQGARAAGAEGHWPGFRGEMASGISRGPATPIEWSREEWENILWLEPIPGLGHSSPVIWGNRIFLTSVVTETEPYLKIGLFGDSPDHPEAYDHEYRVLCLDRDTGEILWQKTAHTGVPKVKRHIKASHANSTATTDGRSVVASFGSEGLFCFSVDGELRWKQDLGLLDSGAFNLPSLQWGFGSSPIIAGGRVIVQCDVNNQSFLAAFDLETGKPVWRTDRDEIPTWGTPTVTKVGKTHQILVNGFKHIGAYDLATGNEVWRLKGGGDVPVPTPIVSDGIAYITNAHGAGAPMYAIRLDATEGLIDETDSESAMVWSDRRSGAYMQTPIAYEGLVYTCSDGGVVKCYDAKSGEKVYRRRLGRGRSGFTASAVACGGHLYYTSERGEVYVIKAGRECDILFRNTLDEVCMATPAIADGTLYFRLRDHLIAVGEPKTDSK